MAFHPYPQLIKGIFNFHLFGPPRGITRASPWPWIDHRVSGLYQRTKRPFQTRFRCGFTCNGLTLPAKITRSLIMQKVRGHTCQRHCAPTACRRTVSGFYFTPLLGVLFTFPSRYCALSVTKEYLALEGGPPRFPPDFSCLVVLGIPLGLQKFSLTGLSPSMASLSRLLC